MIIEVVGKEIEKIKGDFESYLNGLNMVGEISYSQYSELYDEGTKQIQRAYELGRAELEKENAELRKVAAFQQSSNMSRHFENKKLKEGLAVGSTFNKALNSMNKNLEEERDKYRNKVFDKDEQLTKAKEIIKKLSDAYKYVIQFEEYADREIVKEAEQFLNSEVEK